MTANSGSPNLPGRSPIDDGSEVEESPTNMAKLPADLAQIPPLAFQCTLNSPEINRENKMERHLLARQGLDTSVKIHLCISCQGPGSCTKPGLCRVSGTAWHDTAREKLCQFKGLDASRGGSRSCLKRFQPVVIAAARQPTKFEFNRLMKAL